MKALLNNKYALLLGILGILQTQAMEATKDPNAKISLALRANYSETNKKHISDAVEEGLVRAQAYLNKNQSSWYFTALMERTYKDQLILPNYHVSLAVIEHPQNTETNKKFLGKKHVECLSELWRNHIKHPYQYAGQSYGVHMYVHGYDSKGQETHQHYTLPSDHVVQDKGLLVLNKGDMVSDLKQRFKGGISHLHFVLAYEANEFMPGAKERPDIKVNVNKLMSAISNKKNDSNCPMKDQYEGKHDDFSAHTTIGVIKTVKGIVTADSPRIESDNFKDIVHAYELIKNGFNKDKLTNLSFDSFSINGMKSDGKQVTIVEALK